MTYNVLSGTLNPAQSINQSINQSIFGMFYSKSSFFQTHMIALIVQKAGKASVPLWSCSFCWKRLV